MSETPFKERVCKTLISAALVYKQLFVDYEYLIYSEKFKIKKHYIIHAEENNYLHLTGVNSSLSSKHFYNKCIQKTLQETDFDFVKKGQSEKSVIGSVRRKIRSYMIIYICIYCLNNIHSIR